MRLSPIIVGTLIGAAIGGPLYMPIVITHRTTERDGWLHLAAGLGVTAVGFLFGLLVDVGNSATPPDAGPK